MNDVYVTLCYYWKKKGNLKEIFCWCLRNNELWDTLEHVYMMIKYWKDIWCINGMNECDWIVLRYKCHDVFYKKCDVFECVVMKVKWLSREKVFHLVELRLYWMWIQLRDYSDSTKHFNSKRKIFR